MKKKFVLTLALVLMVAVGLSAATPLTVGGTFKTGYEFTFVENGNAIAAAEKGSEAKNAAISISGDFWKVSLSAKTGMLFDAKMAAKAEIYLDKALAEQGMDMGDLTLKMAIGNMGDLGGLSAYSNKRDDLQDLKMSSGFDGAYAASMTVGYGDLVTVMVGVDPVSFLDQDAALAKNNAIILSAKSEPVEGVTAAIAYTNVSNGLKDTNTSADGAFAGSVNIDIAALAGLDFGLGVSAYDLYNFEKKENNLYVELNGSFADFSAWTEYRILDKTNDMKLEVAYAGIENVGLSAFVELGDITKQAAADEVTVKIGGGVNYKMGGVTYALDADYAVQAKTFTMSPTVKISF